MPLAVLGEFLFIIRILQCLGIPVFLVILPDGVLYIILVDNHSII